MFLYDGSSLHVRAHFAACDQFQQSFVGKEASRIHDTTFHSNPSRSAMLTSVRISTGNVVLSAGTTMFAGIGERMTTELTALALSTMKIKVAGASTLSGLVALS